jgi:hypothetical protein
MQDLDWLDECTDEPLYGELSFHTFFLYSLPSLNAGGGGTVSRSNEVKIFSHPHTLNGVSTFSTTEPPFLIWPINLDQPIETNNLDKGF